MTPGHETARKRSLVPWADAVRKRRAFATMARTVGSRQLSAFEGDPFRYGRGVPRLEELLRDPKRLPAAATLYAMRPWEPGAATVAVDQGDQPSGYEYVLEVDLVHEVLDVWTAWRGGRVPSAREAAEAVIHDAEFDAYLPSDE